MLHLAGLPPLHRDPFDRLLVAQALTLQHRLTFATADPDVAAYPVPLSGTDFRPKQVWKDLFWGLAGEFQINAIWTEFNLVIPCDLPAGAEVHPLKGRVVLPQREDTAACKVRQVHLARNTVSEADPDSIVRQSLDFDCLEHVPNLRRESTTVRPEWARAGRPQARKDIPVKEIV
jgi:hypothetical protein